MANYDNPNTAKSKSFWSKPEGKTGALFLIALFAVLGWVGITFGAALVSFAGYLIGKVVLLGALGLIIYMALDGRTRNLFSYMYQSVMRKITSIFVTIDPMGILKNYISDLEGNLKKMGKQIGNLKGQMRNLKTQVTTNNADIDKNLAIARKAKQLGNEKQMVLSSRKAARLKETNQKYVALHLSLIHI